LIFFIKKSIFVLFIDLLELFENSLSLKFYMDNLQTHADNSLFADMQGGKTKAFDVIFNKYYSRLCAYAIQYVDIHDAEEVVQEIMLLLWENRKNIHIESSLSQYLFRAVRNKCLTLINRNRLKEKINFSLYDKFKDQFSNPDFYDIQELTDQIEKAIDRLPESYREAFEMNRFQHKTYQEIGMELGVSAKTVDYRIQQALKLLRSELKDYLPFFIITIVCGG